MVALFTFLSPSLGWQLTATHEQLGDAAPALGVPDHDHDSDDGEHDPAHGMMGHVLTHMPVHLATAMSMAAPDAAFCKLAAAEDPVYTTVPEPPFIPPRSSFPA